MLFVRLFHWALRVEVIPLYVTSCVCGLKRSAHAVWVPHDRCPSCARHIVQRYRAPSFAEAITGIAN